MSECVYGFFTGGDPRNFFPDAESCLEDELENHRKACELWDCEHFGITANCVNARLLRGLGVYEALTIPKQPNNHGRKTLAPTISQGIE